jgi:predicted RNA-binding Zn-ribbon protein involved in translation (DUF1610 family)
MGKVRLECPKCGKAIRVSDTAKKAKCPGCKEIIDVATIIARNAEKSEGQAPEASAEASSRLAEGEQQEEPAEEEQGQKPEEKPVKEGPGDEAVAPPPKRPSRRSSRKIKAVAKVAHKAVVQTGGFKSWIVVAALSVALLVALCFFVKWWAAIMIASAVGVYFDASFSRITRVSPNSPGFSVGPMIWGLIAFGLVVGPVVYILLRSKLLANSADDVADAGMTDEDLEESGKIRAPSLGSPGIVLVLAVVALLAVMFPKPPWLTITLGDKVLSTKSIPKASRRSIFDENEAFDVLLQSRSAAGEAYKTLTCVVVRKVNEDSEDAPAVVEASTDWDPEVAADPEAGKSIWILKKMAVDKAGRYVLKVLREDGEEIKRTELTIRSVQ